MNRIFDMLGLKLSVARISHSGRWTGCFARELAELSHRFAAKARGVALRLNCEPTVDALIATSHAETLSWESQAGKSGYSPACANEWRAGICEKPRVKCSECGHRQLVALTAPTLYDHLSGRHTIGRRQHGWLLTCISACGAGNR
jgi:DNA-directed RNA polymerase subunit RPC12/RpoP